MLLEYSEEDTLGAGAMGDGDLEAPQFCPRKVPHLGKGLQVTPGGHMELTHLLCSAEMTCSGTTDQSPPGELGMSSLPFPTGTNPILLLGSHTSKDPSTPH